MWKLLKYMYGQWLLPCGVTIILRMYRDEFENVIHFSIDEITSYTGRLQNKFKGTEKKYDISKYLCAFSFYFQSDRFMHHVLVLVAPLSGRGDVLCACASQPNLKWSLDSILHVADSFRYVGSEHLSDKTFSWHNHYTSIHLADKILTQHDTIHFFHYTRIVFFFF